MKNKSVVFIAGLICLIALVDGIIMSYFGYHDVSAVFYTIACITGYTTWMVAEIKFKKS